MPIRLSEEEFAELVDEAVASLPAEFEKYMENLSIDIQPRPTRELLRSMRIPRRELLLGVYHGVPLTEKSVSSTVEYPEQVVIFQRNVEAVCDSEDEIVEQVRKTVLHEVGHHFGLDEEELRRLGYE